MEGLLQHLLNKENLPPYIVGLCEALGTFQDEHAELAFLHIAFPSKAMCSLQLCHSRHAFKADQMDEKDERSTQASKL